MKTKILSLAIALMMLVSIVTSMPVGAIVYDNNDIILDVMDITTENSTVDLTKKRFKDFTPKATNELSWVTKGCIAFPNQSGQNVTFEFNVTKAGTYRVLAATSNDSAYDGTQSMYATLLDGEGNTIESVCTKTVVQNGTDIYDPAVTDLDYVTLTEDSYRLKVGRNTKGLYLWNVKLEYVSDEFTVCSTKGITVTTPLVVLENNKKPADDLGWLPSHRVGVKYTTTFEKNVKVVKDGYYDLYLGAIQYSTWTAPKVSVKVDGETVATNKSFTAGATASETKIAERIYLEAGTTPITLAFSGNSSNGAYVYGFKVVYHPLTDEELTVVSSVEDATIADRTAPTQASTPTNDYGWIPSKFTLLAKTSTAATTATHTVNIMSDGYYDMYLALKNGTDSSTVDIYVDTEVEVGDFATSDMEEDVTTQLVAGPIYLTRGEHTIKIAAKTGSVWYYGFKLSPAAQGGTDEPGDDVVNGITLVKADGSAFTSIDIAGGASVKAKAVITMNADTSAYIIIAQYTDNTATKKMLGTVVMDTVSLASGDNEKTSDNALTLDANCGYVQAFLWTADGNYEPLLAGVSVSK